MKMTDSILFAKTGSTWDPQKEVSSYPYRAYDFIEFFKLCQDEQEIIGIQIDVEGHTVSLMFQEKEKCK